MVETIRFVGLNELEKTQQKKIKDEATKYYEKFERCLRDITSFTVHIKEYKKEGAKCKYSLHVRLNAPSKTFEAEKADWDLERTLHKTFKALDNEIKHYSHPQNKKQ